MGAPAIAANDKLASKTAKVYFIINQIRASKSWDITASFEDYKSDNMVISEL